MLSNFLKFFALPFKVQTTSHFNELLGTERVMLLTMLITLCFLTLSLAVCEYVQNMRISTTSRKKALDWFFLLEKEDPFTEYKTNKSSGKWNQEAPPRVNECHQRESSVEPKKSINISFPPGNIRVRQSHWSKRLFLFFGRYWIILYGF